MTESKEMEALKIISRALEFNDEGEFQSGRLWRIIFNDMVDDKEKSIIEQALIELQQIKSAEPTKALECLEYLKQQAVAFEHSELAIKVANGNYDTIKQALMSKSNAERCWEMYLEKPNAVRMAVIYLKSVVIPNYEDYCLVVDKKFQLTEEEFELLKCEVGECQK